MASRKRLYLLQSKASLWATPLSCALFLALAWLAGRIIPVPSFVYWIIVVLHGLTWFGDLINVVRLSRSSHPGDSKPTAQAERPSA